MSKKNLEVNELSWNPAGAEEPILNSISQYFETGKIYGVIGPNGSGKTSLIRHLLHLVEVKKETIFLEHKDIKQYSRNELAKNIAFVPQNAQVDVDFTAWDVISMGRMPYQGRFETCNEKDYQVIDEAMNITNTAHLKDKKFKNLSSGEAQRVLVARAIAQDTPWIILDEPISHLDIKHQYEVMECLKKRNEEKGTTIIAILHDLNLTAMYCHEVILMKNGKVKAKGLIKDVMTRSLLSEVYEIPFQIITSPETKASYFIAIPNQKD